MYRRWRRHSSERVPQVGEEWRERRIVMSCPFDWRYIRSRNLGNPLIQSTLSGDFYPEIHPTKSNHWIRSFSVIAHSVWSKSCIRIFLPGFAFGSPSTYLAWLGSSSHPPCPTPWLMTLVVQRSIPWLCASSHYLQLVICNAIKRLYCIAHLLIECTLSCRVIIFRFDCSQGHYNHVRLVSMSTLELPYFRNVNTISRQCTEAAKNG